MRKSFLFLIVLIGSFTTFAQLNNVAKAQLLYEDGELIEAMDAIDRAILHEKTKGTAKTWKLRGDIYSKVGSKRVELGIKLAPTVIYERISESYSKVLELDSHNRYKKDCKLKARIAGNHALNDGVESFNANDFTSAQSLFRSSLSLATTANYIDTLATYNLALASEKLKDYPTAIVYFKKCIEFNYRTQSMYAFLIFAYGENGDEAKKSVTLDKALILFPNDEGLQITAMNDALTIGENTKALEHLEKLIEIQPYNLQYLFSLGTMLDNLGDVIGAESAYNKALKISPNYFDVLFNLGALYFNRGVELQNSANQVNDDIDREKKLMEANAEFFKAKVQLEKALKQEPDGPNVLSSLKTIYSISGDDEALKRTEAKLKTLGY